ncbi:MerR family transcriptional regulator [Saccharibacillus endophyticus]|uniref:Transcriptional regulator n=1 Tax=Saccharibacillus endophyticus TaxID=2060666 RepID=A0ABQ2A507_9BACL|nr:MerR family transcriptional regulator [Saccharibacillus endophyticus]GGH84906.1 transcriptional regulator [Saccharibacillus endophyticus]
MNDFLSIREFAQLMGVSVHQVRYFEEKGLLLPAHIEANGYRRYGVDEIYRLSHVLLLRNLNIPVAQVGRVLDDYESEAHERLLRDSVQQLQSEIARLQRIEHFTRHILEERANMQKQTNIRRELRRKPDRKLARWTALGDRTEPTARMLFEAQERPTNLFEADLYYMQSDQGMILYFDAEEGQKEYSVDRILERGLYLCENFDAVDNAEVGQRIEEAFLYIQETFGFEAETFVLIEKSYLSLFGGTSMKVELQVRVGEWGEDDES